MEEVLRLHAFLKRHSFYAVALACLAALVLWSARMRWGGRYEYWFLRWNLFLAILPYLFALGTVAVAKANRGRWLGWPLGLGWLLFLPNSLYLVTDLAHMRHIEWMHMYYFDLTMLMLFAWAGCLLAAKSTHMIHCCVHSAAGPGAGWGFVATTCLLCGFGIFLGRFLRLNSWDVFTRPLQVLADIGAVPHIRGHAVKMTVLFSGLFGVIYLTLIGIAGSLVRATPAFELQRADGR